MLRKIDLIMIRVENIEAAASYYAEVFGLHPRWSGDGSIGLGFQETDAEIVLHCDPTIPLSVEVYYLVDGWTPMGIGRGGSPIWRRLNAPKLPPVSFARSSSSAGHLSREHKAHTQIVRRAHPLQ